MKPLTITELQRLLGNHEVPCVSIFMPTHRQAPGAKEDKVRFKNLVADAERKLAALVQPKEARRLVERIAPMMSGEFWREQLDGLAVFSSPSLTQHYRVPMALPERVVVADTFHVRPLIRYLQSDQRYWVLALSQNDVRFFEGNAATLEPKAPPDLPRSLVAALGPEVGERMVSAHSAGAGGHVFHGATTVEGVEREELTRFFRMVDEAVFRALRDEHAPLILAGVKRYHPVYRAVSRYRHLAEQGVEGNFDRVPPQELHARVWPVARAVLRAREDAALAEYHRVNGNGLSTDDLHAIAAAAVQGRVRRLFFPRGVQVRGAFDHATGEIRERPAQQDVGDDVLDDLAQAVLVRDGEVIPLEKDRMPTKSPVAAVMRW